MAETLKIALPDAARVRLFARQAELGRALTAAELRETLAETPEPDDLDLDDGGYAAYLRAAGYPQEELDEMPSLSTIRDAERDDELDAMLAEALAAEEEHGRALAARDEEAEHDYEALEPLAAGYFGWAS
jgi:hypothetical protein